MAPIRDSSISVHIPLGVDEERLAGLLAPDQVRGLARLSPNTILKSTARSLPA